MPVQIRTLKVRPNPWIEIDSRGLPCGRVPYEQPAGGFDPRTVGASITNVQKIQDAPKLMLGQPIHTFEVDYASEDVLVPNTSYYRRRIIRGELIAADKSTYVAAGGSPRGFEDQDKLLAQIKTDAIAAFEAANGEGAFALLAEQRDADAARAEEVKAAAAAASESPIADAVAKTIGSVERRAGKAAQTIAEATKKGDDQ